MGDHLDCSVDVTQTVSLRFVLKRTVRASKCRQDAGAPSAYISVQPAKIHIDHLSGFQLGPDPGRLPDDPAFTVRL